MPNEDMKQHMNHTSTTAGVWFYTRYRLTTNTKMKTRQRNPPQGMTMPPPHGNQQFQMTSPMVNRQATASLPLKWPATSPPSPDEEAEGTTHLLGRCHTCLSGWYHTPAQAGRYHTPAHVGQYHTPTHAVLIGQVLNMQMGNQKACLGRPQIYV
ncbi:hypothetical protein BS47DRAFT_1358861 [Hydnum rufescens UP504]|uniref:Uncharacterized protein n=1 Tax=Hydnum rufescens UP504 TaxID=1448309 RepID=A0A9P6B6K4_9AGAM|nr:hypothetical protein BS47DRAFT_1358861 [Hydnum rufescens UP504]